MVYTDHAPGRQQFHVITSHVTTEQRCQYTTSVDIKNRGSKRMSLIHNRMRFKRSEPIREQRLALYKSGQ